MERTYKAILNSINSPIVFVDNDHIIQYLNKSAKVRYYKNQGYSDLIGKSLFECHNPASKESIIMLHRRLLDGENEIFLKVSEDKLKVTVIGVRDIEGKLIGYYERFDELKEKTTGSTHLTV